MSYVDLLFILKLAMMRVEEGEIIINRGEKRFLVEDIIIWRENDMR